MVALSQFWPWSFPMIWALFFSHDLVFVIQTNLPKQLVATAEHPAATHLEATFPWRLYLSRNAINRTSSFTSTAPAEAASFATLHTFGTTHHIWHHTSCLEPQVLQPCARLVPHIWHHTSCLASLVLQPYARLVPHIMFGTTYLAPHIWHHTSWYIQVQESASCFMHTYHYWNHTLCFMHTHLRENHTPNLMHTHLHPKSVCTLCSRTCTRNHMPCLMHTHPHPRIVCTLCFTHLCWNSLVVTLDAFLACDHAASAASLTGPAGNPPPGRPTSFAWVSESIALKNLVQGFHAHQGLQATLPLVDLHRSPE